MPITPLPNPPSRTDPINFAPRADAFLDALPQFATEANSLEQSLVASTSLATSTSTITISGGSKSLVTQTGKSYGVGAWLLFVDTTDQSRTLLAQVTSYNTSTGDLVINVQGATGSGSSSSWRISPTAPLPIIYQGSDEAVTTVVSDIAVTTSKVFKKLISSNTSFTFTGTLLAGTLYSFKLILTNAGSAAVTFPASVRWPGGFSPAFTVSGTDIIEFYTDDQGTNWYADVLVQGV